MVDGGPGGGTMRLDRFLWFVRLAKTRERAQAMASDGHLRIDGRAIDRAHAPVRVGNILTFALHGEVRVLRVEALPLRRGPAPEARSCYQDLVAGDAANLSQAAAID
ncbi:RNA-binding S4 domain-containing protein [uncultured Sphingomonas sp.]|uniref:RNA-binding S4 domain-containing protein n=1 Tax=uncultured Sphingomonas sp. TaxID=158754 RepID=UPI002592102C|nr:RNA-binding S4 domain-containing protein [uncultured Sphingomonas sp.]